MISDDDYTIIDMNAVRRLARGKLGPLLDYLSMFERPQLITIASALHIGQFGLDRQKLVDEIVQKLRPKSTSQKPKTESFFQLGMFE